MTAPVPPPAYAEQLDALLPTGRAWDTAPGTVLGELLDAHAEELARFDFDATALLFDMLPSRTTNLIGEWETAVGLPDACSALASTLAQRRAAVRTQLVNRANLNPTSFEAIGALFGVATAVEQLDQARADAATMLDTNGGRWRFVWFIEVPRSADDQEFTTLSDVNTPLLFTQRNTELECRLQALAPSHSLLVVEYV